MVVLNKCIGDPKSGESFFVIRFEEEATRVAMDDGAQLKHAGKGCFDSLHFLSGSLVRTLTTNFTVGYWKINLSPLIQTGQSREETSRDFRNTFRNTKGTRDCERRQANRRFSCTNQSFREGHLPTRCSGASPALFPFSGSSKRNDGHDPGGLAHRRPGPRIFPSDGGCAGPAPGFPRDQVRRCCKFLQSGLSPGRREFLDSCLRHGANRVAACRRRKQEEPCR